MKRNNNYYLRRIDDTFFLYPSDDIEEGEKKMVILNETGAFLWEKLSNNCTLDDLVKDLSEQYDVMEKLAIQHVSDYIIFLSDNGCLHLENEI